MYMTCSYPTCEDGAVRVLHAYFWDSGKWSPYTAHPASRSAKRTNTESHLCVLRAGNSNSGNLRGSAVA